MAMVRPVSAEAYGEARKSTIGDMSPGSARRPIGNCSMNEASAASSESIDGSTNNEFERRVLVVAPADEFVLDAADRIERIY